MPDQFINHVVRAIEQAKAAQQVPGMPPGVEAALGAALNALYGAVLTSIFEQQ